MANQIANQRMINFLTKGEYEFIKCINYGRCGESYICHNTLTGDLVIIAKNYIKDHIGHNASISVIADESTESTCENLKYNHAKIIFFQSRFCKHIMSFV